MIKKILAVFLIYRLFLFLPLFLSQAYLAYRGGYSYTSPSHFSSISHFLLTPWANFDGIYYLIIAAGGYTVDNAGFFPLFPLTIGFLTSLFGSFQAFDLSQYLIALLLVSFFTSLLLVIFYRLVKLDFKSNVAWLSLIFLLFFPTSFFLVGIYAEGLFLLLTVSSFYFARKKKWLMASFLAALLTATRTVGIAILPALLLEFYKNEKTFFSKKLLTLLLIPLGLVSYLYYSFAKWGNAFQFVQAQGGLQNERSVEGIVLLPQTLYRYFKILTTVSPSIYEWWVAIIEISALIFASMMLFIAWKKRIRLSYIIFSIFALIIPASTGTFTGMPRYVLVLFPIFIALALVKNKWVKILYLTIGVVLLVILFALFSKGYYIA